MEEKKLMGGKISTLMTETRAWSESGEFDHLSKSASIFLSVLVKLRCEIEVGMNFDPEMCQGFLDRNVRFSLTEFSGIRTDFDQLILCPEKLTNVLKSVKMCGNESEVLLVYNKRSSANADTLW